VGAVCYALNLKKLRLHLRDAYIARGIIVEEPK
jgi:hypothetical protein